jgi:parvulin-like peptidyl-prolyl isomerase
LVHFLVLGALLFLFFEWKVGSVAAAPARIVITAGQIEALATGFTRTWMRPPDEQELEGLIQDRVLEEVLCREALAMGLDKDDTIIRRRLRQKLEFVSQDLAEAVQPNDADLAAYLREHPEAFRHEPELAFRQVYLSRERRENAEADARALLARLQSGDDVALEELGDPTLLPLELARTPMSEIEAQFGAEFAGALAGLEAGRWSGPIVSGYGLHLVFVSERQDGRPAELAEVRDGVAREWLAARRKELNEAYYRGLLERYQVSVQRPDAPSAEPIAVTTTGSGPP